MEIIWQVTTCSEHVTVRHEPLQIIDNPRRRIDSGINITLGFDPRAVSPAGARGIAQFMPATARGMGLADPFDPRLGRLTLLVVDQWTGVIDPERALLRDVERRPRVRRLGAHIQEQ